LEKGTKLKKYFYFSIINAIDQKNYEYQSASTLFNGTKCFTKLNKKFTSISIFPAMTKTLISTISKNIEQFEKEKLGKKIGGLRDRGDDSNSINKKIVNYIILTEAELSGYEIKVHILQDINIFYEQIMKKKKLSIAMVPFCDENIRTILDIKETATTFWIDGYKNENHERIVERFKQTIKSVMTLNVDIIIFPEMFLSKSMIEYVEQEIKTHGLGRSQVLVIGTKWEDLSNICYVYNQKGKKLFEQHKQSSFDFNGKSEDLKNSIKTLNLMDIPGIGRIAFGVCLDLENVQVTNIMITLKSDVLIFPAFSPSLNVKRSARNIAEVHNGITFFSNACGALCKEKDIKLAIDGQAIGFVTIPCKKDTQSSQYTLEYKVGEECKFCTQCEAKIINIEYEKIIQDDKKIRCEILQGAIDESY